MGACPTPTEGAIVGNSQLPARLRARFRSRELTGPTSGLAPGYCQANLLVIPAGVADAFEEFCRLNPAPCPLIERLATGDPIPRTSAPAADIRTDLPRYRRYLPHGAEEALDISPWWRDTAVGFLLGCSFTFEEALSRAGLPLRHQEEGRNVPMYRTNRPAVAAGPFAGPLVVSMRPMPRARIAEVTALSAPFRSAHGAPVHHGDPGVLGIRDIGRPDWGDPVTIGEDEVPVFWACGVTSQAAVQAALAAGAIAWAVSHAPGHMFITDLPLGAAFTAPG
jgi:uncharacterized protein YcsI (UPF0317 family)